MSVRQHCELVTCVLLLAAASPRPLRPAAGRVHTSSCRSLWVILYIELQAKLVWIGSYSKILIDFQIKILQLADVIKLACQCSIASVSLSRVLAPDVWRGIKPLTGS